MATKKNEVKPEKSVKPWEVGDVDENTRRAIWSGLGRKSVRELSEDTGLAPEQVHAVRRVLFEEIDVLTVDEQRMKLMIAMNEMIDLATRRARESTDPRNHAGLINAATGAIEKTLKQVKALENENRGALADLNRKRVNELLRLLDATVVAGVKEIAEEHGLDQGDLLEVFNRHLTQEALSLDARAE